MYTKNDLRTINSLDWVKANRDRFLRKENEDLQLAENLVLTAGILTGLAGEIVRLGSWWVVGCKEDWLDGDEPSSLEAFCRLTPFPAAGPNEIRPEALLTAFARKVVTLSSDSIQWIVGDQSDQIDDLSELLKRHKWRRIVAFCELNPSGSSG